MAFVTYLLPIYDTKTQIDLAQFKPILGLTVFLIRRTLGRCLGRPSLGSDF